MFFDKGLPRDDFDVNERVQVLLLGFAGSFEIELDTVLLARMYDGDRDRRHGSRKALE